MGPVVVKRESVDGVLHFQWKNDRKRQKQTRCFCTQNIAAFTRTYVELITNQRIFHWANIDGLKIEETIRESFTMLIAFLCFSGVCEEVCAGCREKYSWGVWHESRKRETCPTGQTWRGDIWATKQVKIHMKHSPCSPQLPVVMHLSYSLFPSHLL